MGEEGECELYERFNGNAEPTRVTSAHRRKRSAATTTHLLRPCRLVYALLTAPRKVLVVSCRLLMTSSSSSRTFLLIADRDRSITVRRLREDAADWHKGASSDAPTNLDHSRRKNRRTYLLSVTSSNDLGRAR